MSGSRVDWGNHGPPPPHRATYYDSPSPYETHHREMNSPYLPPQMPPRSGGPPPDYWGYEHQQAYHTPRRPWGTSRGSYPTQESPGTPYGYSRHLQHAPPYYSGRPYPPESQETPPSVKREAEPVSLAVSRTPPRSNAAGFATPVRTKKRSSDNSSQSSKGGTKAKKGKHGKGDPLSLLAQVCNKAEDDEEEEDQRPDVTESPAPVPTSPAHRRVRPSPLITPTSTPSGRPPLMPHPQISPVDHKAAGGYWASEPPEQYSRRGEGAPYPPPPHHPGHRFGAPPPGYPEWSNEGSPALVERGSFDSVDPERGGPPTPYSDPRARGPPPYYGPVDYPPPRGPMPSHMAQRKYPPPRWSNYPTPPEAGMRPSPYPPHPPVEMGHHPMEPPPHYPARPPHPYAEAHGPHPVRHYPPPQRRPYPPPMHYRPEVGPYTYVQQPHLEEKTVLRKKFSWKHYPELERFLIANRDEYLKHSSMNYTAEQKQYNNWLTERLLEVAAENHYAFDPEDFNFVAIRDRIRCYYKSYVQTARKRGLNLPITKSESPAKSKKSRTGDKDEGDDDKKGKTEKDGKNNDDDEDDDDDESTGSEEEEKKNSGEPEAKMKKQDGNENAKANETQIEVNKAKYSEEEKKS